MIEATPHLSREECLAMHNDTLSLRAARCVPALLEVLTRHPTILEKPIDRTIVETSALLRAWDRRMDPDRVGAAVFEVFFSRWIEQVLEERFDGELAALIGGGAGALAAALLVKDTHGWFVPKVRELRILTAFVSAVRWLTERFGSDRSRWQWGRLHTLTLRHILSGRGDLGRLLDRGGVPVGGSTYTVCNTGCAANFEVRTGANYRIIADLNDAAAGLWAVDAQGQSGHPGSQHYGDGLGDWVGGQYTFLPLNEGAPP
jgi:penicillin amidase